MKVTNSMKLHRFIKDKRKNLISIAILIVALLTFSIVFNEEIRAALGGFSSNSTSAVNLSKGLVGHWKLDGDSKDSTPYSNHGTISGNTSTTSDRSGNQRAMSFDGSGDFINVGNPAEMQITGSQTISLWVKPSNFSARRNPYAKAYGGEGTITQETNGSVNYYYGTNGGNSSPYQGFTMTNSLTLNEWNHTVIVRDLASMQLHWYKNGVQTNSTGASYASATASSNSLYIGQGYTSDYAGSIDDVRVYNRPLNVNEVEALYDQYEANISVSDTQKGLVGHWGMDGDYKDSTPYANHGSLTSGTVNFVVDRKSNTSKAADFASGSDISVGNDNSLAMSDELTISLWVKLDSYGTYYAHQLVSRWIGTSNANYALYLFGDYNSNGQQGLVRLYATNGGSWGSASGSYRINTGEWYHISIGYNSSSGGQLYVNGEAVGSRTGSGALATPNTNTVISHGDGVLDDVRIYNHELSGNQIKELYERYDANISVSNLQKDLVGYWPFSSSMEAKDATPYSNNGVVSGTTLTNDRTGNEVSAYNFNGSDQHIDIASDDNLKPPDEITVSAWFYRDAQASGWNPIVEGGGNLNNGTGYYFGFSSNSSAFRWRVGDGTYVDTTTTLNTGEWYHVAATFSVSDGTTKLYVNSSEVDSNTHSKSSISYSSEGVTIGRLAYCCTSGHHFDGKIDDVRIWSRALTQAEVERLYETH